MSKLDEQLEQKLILFARTLVDQRRAEILIPPQRPESGFWFGGGNLIASPSKTLYLVGRYRNAGDSRTGTEAGERGLELAVFSSVDGGDTFDRLSSFSKADLSVADQEVLSIEGSALHWTPDGVELFVSTEKNVDYPAGLESFHKPGTGVWTIDHLAAASVEELKNAPVRPLLGTKEPRFVHVKDPVAYDAADGGFLLLFCTHPYCWSSSNTGYALRRPGTATLDAPCFDFFRRGFTWDVAITRATAVVDMPRVGAFEDLCVSLVFYDGGESLRNLDEHAAAVHRPRGYSCEEIGGVAYFVDGNIQDIQRLSVNEPLFISPHGTGCSRYVDVLATDVFFFATWQQSQPDSSQPLVVNRVPRDELLSLLK